MIKKNRNSNETDVLRERFILSNLRFTEQYIMEQECYEMFKEVGLLSKVQNV